MIEVLLALPDGDWLEVLRSGDAAGWAQATAAALCAGEEPAPGLAEELEVLARGAERDDALIASALLGLPDLEESRPYVIASLVLTEVSCGRTVSEVVAELAVPGRHDVSPAGVTVLPLPAGDAVRLHTVTAAQPGAVVEAVDVVLPLGDGTGLRLQLSWLALAAGEELAELADRCAAGLSLTR